MSIYKNVKGGIFFKVPMHGGIHWESMTRGI
jgi:hypothetical protein